MQDFMKNDNSFGQYNTSDKVTNHIIVIKIVNQ